LARIRTRIRRGFASLAPTFEVTSPESPAYNCIAWAAGETSRWWWPSPIDFWPPTAPREETLQAFVAAFATLGYRTCADGSLEADQEKLALYSSNGIALHMARQMPSGVWTSKLGQSWDIAHLSPNEVAGDLYGNEIQFLARQRRF
jgi:hypothetical protein